MKFLLLLLAVSILFDAVWLGIHASVIDIYILGLLESLS